MGCNVSIVTARTGPHHKLLIVGKLGVGDVTTQGVLWGLLHLIWLAMQNAYDSGLAKKIVKPGRVHKINLDAV